MICKQCQNVMQDKEIYCSKCGTKAEPSLDNNQTSNNNSALFANYDYQKAIDKVGQDPTIKESLQGRAIATLVLGILSLVFVGLNYLGVPYVHLVGIVLGIIATALAAPIYKYKIPSAVAGLIMGIIGICLGVLAIIIGIIIAFTLF